MRGWTRNPAILPFIWPRPLQQYPFSEYLPSFHPDLRPNLVPGTTRIPYPYSCPGFHTFKHVQHSMQIWNPEYILQFLGNHFWLLQCPDLTPRDDKNVAPTSLTFHPFNTTGFLSFHALMHLNLPAWETRGGETWWLWHCRQKKCAHVYLPT